jgi:NAD(P)-dependent dehydrogenase (short-subunit alcohol dehydrogenase family)
MAGRLEGKVALVTGSGAGMGRAIAKRMASEGASVVVAEWDEAAARGTREQIEQGGGRAAEIVVDVSLEENAEAMVAFAVERFGRLDVLHNQVFALEAGPIENITLEGWNLTMQHTLTAAFLGTRAALPVMKSQQTGSIINTASISAFDVGTGLAAYGAAKAGVIALTRYTAVEYGPFGIRANSISPGSVETDAFLQNFGESSTNTILRGAPSDEPVERSAEELAEMRRGTVEATTSKRMTMPDDIADVALFLAGDESRAVTGENLVADGGVSVQSVLPSMV